METIKIVYHRAMHGYSGGTGKKVNLDTHANFGNAKDINDIAAMAKSIEGSIGFTFSPNFP